MPFPFRQDSSFWYLTGIDVAGAILVMDKTKDYIILPKRSSYSDIFDGEIDTTSLTETSGIDEIVDEESGWKLLGQRLKRSKHAATIAPLVDYVEVYNFYSNPGRARVVSRMRTYNEELELLDLKVHLAKLRSVKQPEEVEAIKAALEITKKALKKIKRNIEKYEHEYDVEAVILAEFKSGNSKPAFNSIVASGKNASVIHHIADDSVINPQDLLLIDIGAEIENYSADVTRTFSVNNKPSKRQRQIYEAVLDVQKYAMSQLRPGVLIKEYEEKVAHYMGEQLRVLGLINSIEPSEVRKYFPTATSHFLGLDTHDVGSYEEPLVAGMILTVEPGIYIPEEGIGVRIEDDVIITEEGIEVLSVGLPSLIN
jgi:Xaa-Pro aminopeptidase